MTPTTLDPAEEQHTIEEGLADVLEFICKNPLLFVSETDVHVLVLRRLMEIQGLGPKDLYPTRCSIGFRKGKPSKKRYKTMRIHKEYGIEEMDNSRLDAVILDQASLGRVDDPKDLKADGQWIQAQYAFEFGTEKSGGSERVFYEHVRGDLEKLSKARRGYLIDIHRNLCQSTGGRLEKNRAKCAQWGKSILRALMEVSCPNVSTVFLLVDIGNENRAICKEGKVKIFRDTGFDAIPQDSIRDNILTALRTARVPDTNWDGE